MVRGKGQDEILFTWESGQDSSIRKGLFGRSQGPSHVGLVLVLVQVRLMFLGTPFPESDMLAKNILSAHTQPQGLT